MVGLIIWVGMQNYILKDMLHKLKRVNYARSTGDHEKGLNLGHLWDYSAEGLPSNAHFNSLSACTNKM